MPLEDSLAAWVLFRVENKILITGSDACGIRSRAGGKKRLLVDFLIGAHAFLCADRLLTLDPHRYVQNFPKLRLI
jgi:predicted nucleic acid-binding protein